METYTTIRGVAVSLADLTEEQKNYLAGCYAAYQRGMRSAEFGNRFVFGLENPLLKTTGGMITQEVWDHPLFKAVHDLEFRLGIAQRNYAQEDGIDISSDPFQDEWIPVSRAAAEKGVTPNGIYLAVKRGDIVASQSGVMKVSARSLQNWHPDLIRQASRKKS